MKDRSTLALHSISKSFPGVKALDDVSFEVNPGEVHALVGENGAGKTTLINIIAGNYHTEDGFIELKGEKVDFRNYHEALQNGISVVYQERSLVPNMNVAENIFADRQPKTALGFIHYKKMYSETEKICKEIHLDVKPTTIVENLISAKQQMVEIAKALSNNSELLILDEPTATITENETKILFDVINRLKKSGICIIYISHRLQEIFQIADRVTVLKDGKHIATKPITDVCVDDVVRMMVGRDLDVEDYIPSPKDEDVLEVRGLTSKYFKEINFSLKKGEILCFAGLSGAGRTEVARAIIGADNYISGDIFVQGKRVTIKNPEMAIKYGIGYLPEDRKEQGLFLDMSVAKNIISGRLESVANHKIINDRKIDTVSGKLRDRLRIVPANVRTIIRQLSGGNQQKVVFAKWLLANPEILIIDEPTRGVDVGAKFEIYKIIRELSSNGTSIIVISSDLLEVLTISDRIIVMHNGGITGKLERHEATEEKIIHYASGITL